jgi:hypothetical protein
MRPDPERLFFVVSTGRCGSTLLQAMLSSHPRLYIPPELRYFGRHDPIAAFTDPLGDADVEAYLARCAMDPWWQDMGWDRAQFEQAVRGGLRSSRDIYLWVLGHIAEKRGNTKPHYGEKTTYYALHGDRIDQLFPRARFIHIYRDPRDVAASYLEQYWCTTGTALGCARFIKRVYDHAERLAARVGPARFYSVRYESLVEDLEGSLRRVCAFLGEDYDPAMLRYEGAAASGYLEVEESWKGLTRQSVTRSRIGRYASRLNPRQVWMIERTLGPLLTRHGYEMTARHPGPLRWQAAYWGERLYRGALWSVGIGRPLLDEQALLARRNEMFAQRQATPVKT